MVIGMTPYNSCSPDKKSEKKISKLCIVKNSKTGSNSKKLVSSQKKAKIK